jgi:hypothetical protein
VKRIVPLLGVIALSLGLAVPALAADPVLPATGPVQIVIDGDMSWPSGQHAAALVVIQGDAVIEGTALTVTVLGGTVTLAGTVETLTVVDGRAELLAGSRVLGDVVQLNSLVHRTGDAYVGGAVRPLAESMAGFGLFLGTALILFWIGAALTMLVAALLLAAFAARQVRTAEAIISGEPLKTFLAGLGMIVIPPLAIVLLALTIVGLPLALTLLFLIWPTLAFAGYLVAAIWLGDWLLVRMGRREPAERPYLGAVVGMIAAGILGLVPLIGAIISIFGLGAVTIAGWRTLVGRPGSGAASFRAQPARLAG